MSLKPTPHHETLCEPKTKQIVQKPENISVPLEENDKVRKLNLPSAGAYIDRIVDAVKPEREDLKKIQAEVSQQLDKLKATATYFMRESTSTVTRFETVSRKFIEKKLLPITDIQKSDSSTASSQKSDPNYRDAKTSPKDALSSPSIFSRLISGLKNIKSPSSGKMSDAPRRPMRYPYTFTSKVVQFPWKFMFNNNWMFKYYFIAVGVSFPLFYKLSRMSNQPENVKKWDEIRRRDFGMHH